MNKGKFLRSRWFEDIPVCEFHVFGSYTFRSDQGTHRLVFQLNNILDETYYNHLSKIKLIMPESGRSLSLQYRYLF